MKKYIFKFIIFIIILYILFKLYSFTYYDNESFSNILIPKVIFLSYKTKDIPSYIIPNLIRLNPKYEIQLYDDDDCRQFLFENYSQEYVDLFNFLKDGPIKSDFWRVCILYKYGGVYCDIDVELLVPLDEIIEKDVSFLTCNSLNGDLNPHLIMTVKNHPLLLSCINTYLQKYRNNIPYDYEEYSIVHIMYNYYTNILNKNINEGIYMDNDKRIYQILKEEGDINNLSEVFCSYKSRKILNNRYKTYDQNTHTFNISNNIEQNNLSDNTIPKILYLSYKTKNIPPYIINNLIKLNPDYKIKLYDNDDCREFLLQEYTPEYLDLFNFLRDGPIKADFWRVCVLYKYGGVYSDIDVEYLVPLDYIIEPGVTFLTCGSYVINGINPHLIMTVKNHPLLLDCINTYLNMYRNKVAYGYWTYSIVYNVMMPNIKKYIKYESQKEGILLDKYNNKYQILSEVNARNYNEIYCSYKSVKVLNNRYKNYDHANHTF
jgi:mannosyltransferase OCH1-like enzyme